MGELRYHPMYENSTLCTKWFVRTSSKCRWSIYRTSIKCHWSINRTSRKRRGTLRFVHKVERSSPTVIFVLIFRTTPWLATSPHSRTRTHPTIPANAMEPVIRAILKRSLQLKLEPNKAEVLCNDCVNILSILFSTGHCSYQGSCSETFVNHNIVNKCWQIANKIHLWDMI